MATGREPTLLDYAGPRKLRYRSADFLADLFLGAAAIAAIPPIFGVIVFSELHALRPTSALLLIFLISCALGSVAFGSRKRKLADGRAGRFELQVPPCPIDATLRAGKW